MAKSDPWLQLDNEGDIPYADFWRYLSLPLPRPTTGEYAKTIGKTQSTISKYSSRYNWAQRLQSWDARLHDIEVEAVITEREKMTREHLQALRAARILGTLAIQDHLRKAKAAKVGKIDIGVRSALALLKESMHLERLILGEATERVETRELDVDVSKLTGEEAEQLLAILAKMEAE